MELIKNKNLLQEGEKRDYVPYTLIWNCKSCLKKIQTDFNDVYFSYPTYGNPFENTVYYECDCGYENERTLKFEINKVLTLLKED